MNDDEKGKRFLELIDDQNNIQWKIVAKLTSLISSGWESEDMKNELKNLVDNHAEITKELNSLDDKGSLL
ncbi:MAG: hypothetical protein ACE5RS_04250 [Nitrosopumilus sp.]|jgi:hypothetical protein|nr:hypothetical protein [Nitrosopumilus sp.]